MKTFFLAPLFSFSINQNFSQILFKSESSADRLNMILKIGLAFIIKSKIIRFYYRKILDYYFFNVIFSCNISSNF